MTNVRAYCAEIVSFADKDLWPAAREILYEDDCPDIRASIKNIEYPENISKFIVPPLLRSGAYETVGAVFKFNHSVPPKYAKINSVHLST